MRTPHGVKLQNMRQTCESNSDVLDSPKHLSYILQYQYSVLYFLETKSHPHENFHKNDTCICMRTTLGLNTQC